MDSLTFQTARCRRWLTQYALPRWLQSQSNQTGIFAEGFVADGQEFSRDLLRFRVQPRQVYVFAHATELGLIDGRDQVNAAIKSGFSYFSSENSGYRFAIAKHNNVKNEAINLYEQAFALLGFAWHYKLTADLDSLAAMETIYKRIFSQFWDNQNSGFFETKGNTKNKGQNPHMHLFEALMVSYEHTKNPIWLERATQIYQLFCTHFLQGNHLIEFFQADFSPDPETGSHVDPGHHYEWIWLLNHYEKLTGTNVNRAITTLLNYVQQYGHNANGLVRDEIYANGNPLRSTSRLWCQTEYLKARIALWERDPSDANHVAICQAIDRIFVYYLKPAKLGLWIDQVDEKGLSLNEHSPASTFYHLFLAFSEVLRFAARTDMHLSIPPTINYLTGHIDAKNLVSKETSLGDLEGVFADEVKRSKIARDKVIYQVEMLPAQQVEGELNFGVTHIEPGLIGEEFHMTRGHIHQRKEQAEFYFGSQGEGLLLMQSEQGDVSIEKVFPGSIHHIPGFVAHRLINTGRSRLSALAVWPATAGHNYDFLNEVGFNVRVLRSSTGYKIIPNNQVH